MQMYYYSCLISAEQTRYFKNRFISDIIDKLACDGIEGCSVTIVHFILDFWQGSEYPSVLDCWKHCIRNLCPPVFRSILLEWWKIILLMALLYKTYCYFQVTL